MNASDMRGTVTLSDGSGDLGASGLAGDIRLDDGSGNIIASGITASGLTGGIQLDNNSGDITASDLTGDLHFQDDSGNIVVNGLAGTDVVGGSLSGDITVTFTEVPDLVHVTDSSGNIMLVLPPGATAYDVNASTSPGNKAIAVPTSSSSKHVIIVTDQSGDITVTR
jgi:DUF4097 and DUF4098 domain-containing protein YvlB